MITITCPFCGKPKDYDISDKDVHAASKRGRDFYKLPSYIRELFITGICYECQSKTFRVSTPGYDLGEVVGSCNECGSNLYAEDIKNGYCGSCHCPIETE